MRGIRVTVPTATEGTLPINVATALRTAPFLAPRPHTPTATATATATATVVLVTHSFILTARVTLHWPWLLTWMCVRRQLLPRRWWCLVMAGKGGAHEQ